MKRLFEVVNGYGVALRDDAGNVRFFDTKPAAKAVRDEVNKQWDTKEWTVTPGPDHNGLVRSSHRNTRKRKLRGTRPVKHKA